MADDMEGSGPLGETSIFCIAGTLVCVGLAIGGGRNVRWEGWLPSRFVRSKIQFCS